MFSLDPRLAADTFELGETELCKILLMNDSRYIWVILVPKINGVVELHDLPKENYDEVMNTVRLFCRQLGTYNNCEKINIGALGNVVSQLHIHIISRRKSDTAWPGPVWGHSASIPYTEQKLSKVMTDLKKLLYLN